MAGTSSVPNVFATQAGLVPAAQLDANWNAVTAYVNSREVSSGTLASRPTAPSAGTWYFANDQNGGTLYFAAATGWVQVAPGISGSTTLTAPLVLSDATAGGAAHPFLEYRKVGSASWLTYWQKPANFASSETLTFATSPATGLQLHLIHDPGGQRVAVWDPSNPLPNVPHTGILPTMAVYGDVLMGDIIALESNPMTYFIRANTNILHTAVTQLFSNRRSAGAEPDSGPTIIMAPMKNGGGAFDDGYIRLEAYGGGTGAQANEIQFRQRQGSNTVVNRWAVGGAGILYTKDSDNALDIGSGGNRIRSLYAGSNLFVAGQQLAKGRLSFTNAGTAGAILYWGTWAADAAEATAYIQHLMPFGGVLRNLFCKLTSAPGAGLSHKFTVRVNGTSSTLVATIATGATTANDQANSATVSRGDYVTLEVSHGGADIFGTAAVEIDPI